ncbi:hypothetical protein [Streptomyces sp. NPDC056190]|uniref:hypothetical protein n=1 Tax=Streptomyces sp. NPDC056190 TaxID=3345741 RepID=UPI0035D7EDEC
MTVQQSVARRGALTSTVVPVVAYSVIYTLTYLIPNLLPLFTGVVIDVAGFGAAQSGWVATAFLGSMTIAALASAFLVTRIAPVTVALAGLLVQLVGYGLPFLFEGAGAVVFAMSVVGFGVGALFAVANASAAQEKRPALIYGAGIVLSNVACAFVPDPLYRAVDQFGVPGMFLIPLAIAPFALVSLRVIANKPVPPATTPEPSEGKRPPRMRLGGPAIALLAAIALTNIFNLAYYNFADRLLVAAGFGSDRIAGIFTAVFFSAAVFGGIACAMSAVPRWLTVGLLVATALLAVVIVIAIATDSQTVLLASACAQGGVSMLVISVQLAVAAQIDPTGRVAAVASGVLFASWTVGPSLGGEVLEISGFEGISHLAVVLGLVSTALLAFVHRRTRQSGAVVAPDAVAVDGV